LNAAKYVQRKIDGEKLTWLGAEDQNQLAHCRGRTVRKGGGESGGSARGRKGGRSDTLLGGREEKRTGEN